VIVVLLFALIFRQTKRKGLFLSEQLSLLAQSTFGLSAILFYAEFADIYRRNFEMPEKYAQYRLKTLKLSLGGDKSV